MEYWDLYDNNRHFTGETMRRGDVRPEGRYHTIIGVWTIHDTEHRILITKRAPNKKICPNTWENTGGSVLSGENSRDGAAREVREETGMPCQPEDLIPITSIRIPSAFVDCFIYHTNIPTDGIILQPGETVDWRWVTLEDINALIKSGEFAAPEIEQFNACKGYLAQALTDLEK